MEDALESGWVSVRPNVFEEKEKHKFVFIVAWNEIEGKFAVTCHDRTVQKRSAVLDSGDGPPPVLEPEDAPAEEPDFSWAGLFSFQDMRSAHLQLCAVNSDLEPCLPAFPEEQSVWSVLFGAPELSARDTDALCFQLQVYLGHALDTCGWKILNQVLFPDSEDSEEYYESLSELRQKGYEDALQRAKRHLQQVRAAPATLLSLSANCTRQNLFRHLPHSLFAIVIKYDKNLNCVSELIDLDNVR